jgi:pSer/pThr/pTyr-binding forkhead associated (FHA) protein
VPVGGEMALTGPVTVGRDAGSDIVLAETVVSGTHARLVPRGRGYTVEDLGSTNGTFVDDQPVAEAQLRRGSRLRIGDTVFRYEE